MFDNVRAFPTDTSGCGVCATSVPEGITLWDRVVEAIEPERQEVQVEHFYRSCVEGSQVLILV